ncbi:CLUMA_CG010387, isoform A [Clunio marinus]|uniref:CLUMA_CG010387, isoform A n=1 Tax=Clunio marinus TaxID=568069 RepID=A0A1J1I9P8_9DIPT|nr:CLUMA_CG010387, isoform A [Clunio marinus]
MAFSWCGDSKWLRGSHQNVKEQKKSTASLRKIKAVFCSLLSFKHAAKLKLVPKFGEGENCHFATNDMRTTRKQMQNP